jgi:hypothetical protein
MCQQVRLTMAIQHLFSAAWQLLTCAGGNHIRADCLEGAGGCRRLGSSLHDAAHMEQK